MKNLELRKYASNKNVHLWQVGEHFGMNDTNFSKKMRHEFSPEDAQRFRQYVDQIAQGERT